jgi:hypothetical protein
MIYEAYHKEAKIKREILQEVVYHSSECMAIFHLTAWTYQTSISDHLKTLLEILLITTKARENK